MCLESKARAEAVSDSRPDKAIGYTVRKYCTYSIGLHYPLLRRYLKSLNESNQIVAKNTKLRKSQNYMYSNITKRTVMNSNYV